MKRKMVFVMALALAMAMDPCFYKTVKAKEIKQGNIERPERKPEDTGEKNLVENEAAATEKTEEAETEELLLKDNTTTERDITNEETLNIEEGTTEGFEDETGSRSEETFFLQIPQEIKIVMDPWEMDGKEQIYSKEYIVKNCGETAGHLVLSELTCKAQTEEINVQTNKEGLHIGDEKSIYMEMVFGDGERIILSQEDSEYETDLEPGEEVVFCFSGEMNENAPVEWAGSDVAVSVAYSWDTEPEEKNILPENDSPTGRSAEKNEANLEKVEKEKREDKADIDGQKIDNLKKTEEDEEAEAEEIGSSIDELVEEKNS